VILPLNSTVDWRVTQLAGMSLGRNQREQLRRGHPGPPSWPCSAPSSLVSASSCTPRTPQQERDSERGEGSAGLQRHVMGSSPRDNTVGYCAGLYSTVRHTLCWTYSAAVHSTERHRVFGVASTEVSGPCVRRHSLSLAERGGSAVPQLPVNPLRARPPLVARPPPPCTPHTPPHQPPRPTHHHFPHPHTPPPPSQHTARHNVSGQAPVLTEKEKTNKKLATPDSVIIRHQSHQSQNFVQATL